MSPSAASSRAPRSRRSAAARRNGRRPGLPTALRRLWTRLVINAVLPDLLSPVTARRSVRSRSRAVKLGTVSSARMPGEAEPARATLGSRG